MERIDEKQIVGNNKAVGELNDSEQSQIAGGGVISDKQCAKLQKVNIGIAYGCPCPSGLPEVIKKKMQEALEKAKQDKESTQPILDPETGNR